MAGRNSRACSWLLILVACALVVAPAVRAASEESDRMAQMFNGRQFGRGKDKKAPAVKADIPFIRCGVCESLVSQTLGSTANKRTTGKLKQEDELLEELESICDPDTDAGDWITHFDLQEKGSKLELVPMGKPGECGSECRTIARACEIITEDADLVEYSQALWAASKRSDLISQKWRLTDVLCQELTDACVAKTPAVPKTRTPGPEFKALSEDDLSLRNTMRAMRKAGMGGTLFNRDEVMGMQDKLKMGGDGEEAGGDEL